MDAMDVSLDELIPNCRNRDLNRGRNRKTTMDSCEVSYFRTNGRGCSNDFNNLQGDNVNAFWTDNMYNGPNIPLQRSGVSINNCKKIIISNLTYYVTSGCIQEIFTVVGPVKAAFIHYDIYGRSLGTAEVVFCNNGDALKAIDLYNNRPLEGYFMKIELATNEQMVVHNQCPSASYQFPVTYFNKLAQDIRGVGVKGKLRRRYINRVQFGGQVNGGSNARRKKKKSLIKEQLDAELENYMELNKLIHNHNFK